MPKVEGQKPMVEMRLSAFLFDFDVGNSIAQATKLCVDGCLEEILLRM